MKRRLRIAVSVFFALVAVAFAVLWVRSYWYQDNFGGSPKSGRHYVDVHSGCGGLFVLFWTESHPAWTNNWELTSRRVRFQLRECIHDTFKFRILMMAHGPLIWFPHWLVVLLATVASILPWAQQRFSLRTMLIATTLIAAVLGLAVWAVL